MAPASCYAPAMGLFKAGNSLAEAGQPSRRFGRLAICPILAALRSDCASGFHSIAQFARSSLRSGRIALQASILSRNLPDPRCAPVGLRFRACRRQTGRQPPTTEPSLTRSWRTSTEMFRCDAVPCLRSLMDTTTHYLFQTNGQANCYLFHTQQLRAVNGIGFQATRRGP